LRSALEVAVPDEARGAVPPRRDGQLVHEPGRLLALVLGGGDRRDEQPLTGPGAGDVEQPALLGQHGLHAQRWQDPVAADPVGVQQGRPPAGVGPAPVLHVRDDDEPPLQAFGTVCGEQPDRVAVDATLGQGVPGDLLGA
jgi:hypothetical protein